MKEVIIMQKRIKVFKLTPLRHAKVLGKNRTLEVYFENKVIFRYPSISQCGGIVKALKKARQEAYQEVNHIASNRLY